MKPIVALILALFLQSTASERQVVLNHVFITVDSITFRLLEDSEFLSATFSSFRKATIHADSGSSWTGLYIFGRQTYLEVYEESDKGKPFAIAFGVETAGQMDWWSKKLSRKFEVLDRNRTRNVNGVEVPWFRSVEPVNEAGSGFRSWLMQYEPSYMDRVVAPALNIEPSGSVNRALYNQRVFDSTKLMSDVAEISLLLTEDYRKQFHELMKILGFDHSNNGVSDVFSGPDIIISTELHSTNSLKSIRFKLLRDYCEPNIQLGSSELVFNCGHQTAEWIFKE